MRVWPFRARAEQPDEVLGAVKQGVIAAIAALGGRLTQVEHFAKLIDENATEARKIESRLAKVETLCHSTRELLVDQVERLNVAITNVRGTATGGMRGRGRGIASEIGEVLIEALGSPDQAHQLALQVAQQARAANGHGESGIAGDVPPPVRRA